MQLRRVYFVQYEGQPKEWVLDGLTLEPLNLLVGKNASGKSRSLAIINHLANLLSGATKLQLTNGFHDVTFVDDGKEIHYILDVKETKVRREEYSEDGNMLMARSEGGRGRIRAEGLDQMMEFQTPESEVAAVARLDSIQHPFLQRLRTWSDGVRCYQFGTPLGRETMAILTKDAERRDQLNDKDTNNVIAIYLRGLRDFGDEYKKAIKRDMSAIDYPLDDIGVAAPTAVILQNPPGEVVTLFVKENNLVCNTEQMEMSQGMFRALSLIIQLNYSQMARRSGCILIDDIGEGLDFDRSCGLIELLIEKAQSTSLQLVMSTNDRFVMNRVPLETWSVLQREGSHCRIKNYANSREIFEEFKFTGLNNFDFLATDFLTNAHDLVGKVNDE